MPRPTARHGSAPTRLLLSCLLLVGGAVLTGCGDGSVEITTPSVTAGERAACRALVDDLPSTLAGQPSRPVSPDDALGAAWGKPAITLTCGVPVPEEFTDISDCVEANGVGWFVPPAQAADESADVTWTAVGYRPLVRVQVPADYRPEGAAAVIAALAMPVKRHLQLLQPCA